MNFKEGIVKEFTRFFENVGINPLFGFTLIFFLMVFPSINKLKKCL